MLYLPGDWPISKHRIALDVNRPPTLIDKAIWTILIIFSLAWFYWSLFTPAGQANTRSTIEGFSRIFMCECGQCNDLGTPIPGRSTLCF